MLTLHSHFRFIYLYYNFMVIFYRRGKYNRENSICFDPSDQQFKYGVLTSNEMCDNLEMANIPLTIDSDDDEELEIFDLEGRRQYGKDDRREDVGLNGRLLGKDDVEILDLDLPGYSRLPKRPSESQDDDLLNLDDITEDVLKTSVIKNDPSKGYNNKTERKDDFFDIL